jgi:hypothetical protein
MSRSAALLAEMAKDYGAADQIEDPSVLDSIVFRSFDASVVYSPGRDVFSFSAGLEASASRCSRPARQSRYDPQRQRNRKLRLLRPDAGAKRLHGEVRLDGLAYPDFAGALDDFMDAVTQARAGRQISEAQFTPPPDLPSDDLIWIRG